MSDNAEVVSKAKRAAASLWMVLHSRTCRNNQCLYAGCRETKLLLLHAKTCKKRNSCPIANCKPTRNLILHYQSCRAKRLIRKQDTKAKSEMVGEATASLEEQDSCLVCSLVAQHVRNVLEKGPSAAPVPLIRPVDSDVMPPPPPQRMRSDSSPEREFRSLSLSPPDRIFPKNCLALTDSKRSVSWDDSVTKQLQSRRENRYRRPRGYTDSMITQRACDTILEEKAHEELSSENERQICIEANHNFECSSSSMRRAVKSLGDLEEHRQVYG